MPAADRRRATTGASIHPGVDVRAAPRVFEDASGAPAVLAFRGFVFAFDTLGETTLRLIGDPGTGNRIHSKIARDVCTHAYLVLIAAAVDEDWRERNIRLYDDAPAGESP